MAAQVSGNDKSFDDWSVGRARRTRLFVCAGSAFGGLSSCMVVRTLQKDLAYSGGRNVLQRKVQESTNRGAGTSLFGAMGGRASKRGSTSIVRSSSCLATGQLVLSFDSAASYTLVNRQAAWRLIWQRRPSRNGRWKARFARGYLF